MTTQRRPTPDAELYIYLLAAAAQDRNDEEWDQLVDGATAGRQTALLGELLWLVSQRLARYRQNIARLERALDKIRARDINERGPARYADTFVTVAPDNKRRIIDTDALLGWLDQAGRELGVTNLATNVFRISDSNLRIQTFRNVARRLAHHRKPDATEEELDAYQATIEETFIDIERGEPKLKEIPIDKAPKYAQKLEHGHRAGSFTNQPEEN